MPLLTQQQLQQQQTETIDEEIEELQPVDATKLDKLQHLVTRGGGDKELLQLGSNVTINNLRAAAR